MKGERFSSPRFMSCYHPWRAFPAWEYTNEKGEVKKKLFLFDYDTTAIRVSGDTVIPITGDVPCNLHGIITESFVIPCGKCIGCRLDYARSWSDRMLLEYERTRKAVFATLTYNAEHLPTVSKVDPDTGELVEYMTLLKRDLQLFMKRLRKHFEDREIRFFACGEYGDLRHRPHYHLIIFGIDLNDFPDRRISRMNELKQMCYDSKVFDNLWSERKYEVVDGKKQFYYDPIGFTLLGEFSEASANYTARYVLKKQLGQDAMVYDILGIQRPFTLMSRNPGIGMFFYDEHKDEMLDFESWPISTPKGAREVFIPKAFLRKYSVEFPDDYDILKKKRKESFEAREDSIRSRSSLSDLERYKGYENSKLSQVRSLNNRANVEKFSDFE